MTYESLLQTCQTANRRINDQRRKSKAVLDSGLRIIIRHNDYGIHNMRAIFDKMFPQVGPGPRTELDTGLICSNSTVSRDEFSDQLASVLNSLKMDTKAFMTTMSSFFSHCSSGPKLSAVTSPDFRDPIVCFSDRFLPFVLLLLALTIALGVVREMRLHRTARKNLMIEAGSKRFQTIQTHLPPLPVNNEMRFLVPQRVSRSRSDPYEKVWVV